VEQQDGRRPAARATLRRALSALGLLFFGCLLVAMVAVSGYGGLQAGQTERSVRSTGTANAFVLERFQRGLDELQRGNYVLAQANFEEVLRYQPGNLGVQNLIVTAQVAQTPSPTPVTPTPTPFLTDKGELLQAMRSAGEREDWDAVISLSDQLRALDSAYQSDEVNQLRFRALVTRGLERLSEGQIEAGLYDLDLAATIQALDDRAESQRQIAALYQNAVNYYGADWEKTIKLLSQVYALSPGYRDVAAKLYEAYMRLGDVYGTQQEWCPAEKYYTGAVGVINSAEAGNKLADAQQRCLTATPVPITATLGGAVQSVPGMSGRLSYAAFDPGAGYYTLYLYDSGAGQASAIEAGGAQPAFHRAGVVMAYSVGSALRGFYSNGAVGTLFNAGGAWPSLSPDANRIAYASIVEGAWRIYVAPLDGSAPPQELIAGSYPIWGPAGLIAFQGCPGGNCGLYAINPDQPADLRQLSTSAGDISPQWSPDGNTLVYATNFTGAWELYSVTLSGQFQQLTSFGAQCGAPVWSPDGSRIAFESNRDGAWAIYIMNRDGSNVRKLIDLGAQHPSWQTERLAWGP
jgi:tetratricopeptide (TPR) repeat protein